MEPEPGPEALTPRNTWIVVPAFNEAARLGRTLRDLAGRWPSVVVVDDGSVDGTSSAALEHAVWLLRHPVNGGQGLALTTGIAFALQSGARAIVTFDADGQHDAADIDGLLEPLRAGAADVVLGSRFLGRDPQGMPPSRRLLLRLAVRFTRATTGLQITDAHNGLRAMSRAAAQRLRLVSSRMAHASEFLDQLRVHRLRYVEVPVTIRYTAETLAKGQGSLAAVRIASELALERLIR